MMGELYDALLSAGADNDKARSAATEVASFENRLSGLDTKVSLLTWMVGTVITLQIMTLGGLIGLLWKVFPAAQ
jgi:hypothetical protein